MLKDILLLVAGLALIVKGGEFFVAAAMRLAEFLRMPRVVIGSTLVSLATTCPEMVVSVMSGLRGESGLAVGNAVGSVMCNIGLVLGTTAALKQVDIHWRSLILPLGVMFASGVALLLMTLDLSLTRGQGVVLLAAGTAYFAWDFISTWRVRKPAEVAEASAIEKEITASRWAWLRTRPGTAVQFILGAGVVVLGSRLLVDGAVSVAAGLGIPAIVIGLTVVALGTSLPEFITAISSTRKNVSDLAVGNVLGANIANLTLVVGAAAVINDVRMDRATQVFNFPAMLGLMLLLVWMLRTDKSLSRREGVALLAVYAIYLAFLMVLTPRDGGL
jgi:cation:H+ antiporter